MWPPSARRRLALLSRAGATLLATLAVHGCANGGPTGDTGYDAGTDDASLVTVEASAADTSKSDAPDLVGDGASNDAPPNCSIRCSPDLRQVTDCSDPPHVITTCPPDQGCGPGFKCIPACDSAAANKSSIGCDYYSIPADGYSAIPEFGEQGGAEGSCFAAFVTNTWDLPIHVKLEWNGQQVDGTGYAYLPQGTGGNITYAPLATTGGAIQPGQVAIVFMAQNGGLTDDAGSMLQNKVLCPPSVQAAFTTQDIGVHGTGVGNAVHITTDYPAVIYDIYPYGGASSYISSATLLLPTDVWDTNYVAVTAWKGYPLTNTIALPSDVDIVAMQDNTTIQILPKVPITARGTVQGGAANTQLTYTLSKGQVLQFTQIDDLSGSPIQSNNPIGFWGGHYCMQIPGPGQPACDAEHKQIPPVQALSNRYAAVPYRTRVFTDAGAPVDEQVPWRLMGMVNGTQLTYDPPNASLPPSLDVGQVVEFWGSGQFVVHSQDTQHPFYAAAHMTGGTMASDGVTGDPEMVQMIPPEQFLSSYTFFTDPTYSETNLVLVRDKAYDGTYKDVTLDCLSAPVGGWTTIGSSSLQYTRVDVQHLHAAVAGCDNGAHTMKSASPFGITVWGFDRYVSYGYPAGASVKSINKVVVPPNPSQ
jgi:hypothetical protein